MINNMTLVYYYNFLGSKTYIRVVKLFSSNSSKKNFFKKHKKQKSYIKISNFITQYHFIDISSL